MGQKTRLIPAVFAVGSKRPKRKRVTVKVLGIPEKSQDKVSTPHIVRQVAEKFISVRVIAHVLDDGAAVSVGVGLAQIVRGGVGKTREKERADVGIPGCIDDGFVG